MDMYVNKREQLAMINRARGVDFNTATLLDGNYMYFEIYFEIFRSHFFFLPLPFPLNYRCLYSFTVYTESIRNFASRS